MIDGNERGVRERLVNGRLVNTTLQQKGRYAMDNFKDDVFFCNMLAGDDGVLAGEIPWDESRGCFFGQFPVQNEKNTAKCESGFLVGECKVNLARQSTGEEATIFLDEPTAWSYSSHSGYGCRGKHTAPAFIVEARVYGNTRVLDDQGKTWYYLEIQIRENTASKVRIAQEFLPPWQRSA